MALEWFEVLQLNFYQAPNGFVGIHAWKKGETCSYFEVPVDLLYTDTFWDEIHKKSLEAWRNAKPRSGIACPVCGRVVSKFAPRYKGCFFCSMCGSHYKMANGKIVITRNICEEPT